ncbi:MAG: BamA/TamA family outer membrane protein, partial [Bacteroidetes bacterium]|nr:BamA/TamA family outer membrane protein [Bacteroidota bacterium]
ILFQREDTTLIRLVINEGPLYSTGESKITGETEFVRINIPSRIGEPINIKLVRIDAKDIISRLADEGHPHSVVEVIPVIRNSGNGAQVDFEFNVITGEAVILDTVIFRGNKTTQPQFLMSEMRFKRSELYSKTKVDRKLSVLNRLGYISDAKQIGIGRQKDRTEALVVELVESNANRLNGIIGFIPEDRNGQGGFITGLLEFNFGNLFGSGRELDAHWEKIDRNSEEINLSYDEPFPFGYPVKPGISFSQLVQDSSYIKRDLELRIKIPLTFNLGIFANAAREKVNAREFGIRELGLSDYSALSLPGRFNFDDRDFIFNPMSGVYYETSVTRTSRKEAGIGRITGRRFGIRAEYYQKLTERSLLAITINGYESRYNNSSVPFSELYRVGGAGSLRGYREDQFRGARVGWTNIEYRVITGKLSRMFIFGDAGFISGTPNGRDESKLSYGAGIRLTTAIGQIGIDYGIGADDTFSNGKVHLSLNGVF